uniref:Putative tyrosyl-tRNA synthetase n=1 Tax=Trypanosoma vivax (strain Y486) TaxID=1055687 RepID=G0TY42_TRYVY|nr:putative tyrosyl-tRNA synthetase [Trypanosoma vivax Y486]
MEGVLRAFAVPADCTNTNSDCFSVEVEGNRYKGILPILFCLRKMTTGVALTDFIGSSTELCALVNQWVSCATLLMEDAVMLPDSSTCPPSSKQLFENVEMCITVAGVTEGFLACTPKPTVADLILYTAISGHRHGEAEMLPRTRSWWLRVQKDSYLASIVPLSHVVPSLAEKAAAASAVKKDKPAFAKPSPEEILRRQQEKQRAKEAKALGGEVGATSGGGNNVSATKQSATATLDPNQLELRIGRFTNVRRHPNADRLYVEDMDIGTETRTIVSGLVDRYEVEELEGTLCIVVCNMKPKSLKDVKSHGMVLCASTDTELRVVRPPDGAKPGDRVIFGDAFDSDKLQEAKQLSSNLMSDLLSYLRVDATGIVCWRDTPAQQALGVLKVPELPNAVVR